MAIISPTITTSDLEQFNQSLATLQTYAKRVQIDISDGTFAPTQLVPIPSMELPEGIKYDFHIMSVRPSEHIAAAIEKKPALVIVHAELDDDFNAIANQLRSAGIKVGVALLKSTLPSRAQSLISQADHVLIFSGNLGEQGGTADMLQIEKVPLIRAIKSDVEIGWDGGANLSNVRALAHAGVNVINVGGALANASDPAAMYQSLITESEKKGVLI